MTLGSSELHQPHGTALRTRGGDQWGGGSDTPSSSEERWDRNESNEHFAWQVLPLSHLEYFKTCDVQNTNEGCSLALGTVQRPVDPMHQPAEEPLIGGFGQSFHSKVGLRKVREAGVEAGRQHFHRQTNLARLPSCPTVIPAITTNLLFRLCLLHVVSADFDAWGKDGAGELGYIHAQEVTELLGRWKGHGAF